MSLRRFYAEPESFLRTPGLVTLSEEESRHLRDVLRLRAGDEARVFDGEGREFACVVREVGGRREGATLEVRGMAEPPSPEPPVFILLAAALLKGEKFDLVVQKAVELGVGFIKPLMTKRTDVRLRDERDAAKRVERWRRLALEAAKQSGRARVPAVSQPSAFETFAAADPGADSLRLMFAERAGVGLNELPRRDAPPPNVAALVGPEGGWEDEEIELARAHGWSVVTLGGRTLRAETAAITVCALMQHVYGDLK
ncbi:MAG TPA: 16S rRNA (uracil(1498)-N(3))-methyltransferase [Pyrinomonadaceae bacterium]|nr:16S rRNA (uracil(1498)-N(3))-methyltransferase [Pyrinomonadaceae bacterium]